MKDLIARKLFAMKPPLTGIRVVEFEGIGPGPLAGRMLADMGAEVTVIARPQRGAVSERLGGKRRRPVAPRQDRRAARPEATRRDGRGDGARGRRRRADRRQPPRRDGAPRPRAGRLRRAQSAAGLRPHDRLGPERAAGAGGRARPELRRADRAAVAVGAPRRAADRAADRGRRRGRRAGPGLRHGLRAARRARAAATVVSSTARSSTCVAMLGSIAQSVRASGQLDGPEPSPFHDSPFYDVYACADGGFITLGALEPQFYALLLDKLGLADVDPAGAVRQGGLAGAEGALHRAVREPAAGPLVRAARGQRRVLRAGAEHRRGRGRIRTTWRAASYSASANGAVQAAGAPRFQALAAG